MTATRRRLVAASYSPYSERARWALDHHRIAYREVAHTPMLGEPLLRLRTRAFRGRVSIPVFLDGDTIVRDSVEIARHAEARGSGAPLFPPALDHEVRGWIDLSDELMHAGRALLFPRLASDAAALRDTLPSGTPRLLRSLLAPGAKLATRFLARKYGTRDLDPAACEETMERALAQVRAELSDGRKFLTGEFSFADVSVAAALAFVRPVDHPRVPMGPALRACWAHERLAAQSGDLLAWRDRVYAERRD